MRDDYKIILDLIPTNSKVLDIGCSDGELISLLSKKNVSAQGVELNQEKVISCLEKGLDVIHGDINLMVEDFPHNQFDYCILTQTIQAVQKPDVLLNTLKDIGKNIIVSFNNSARLSKIYELFISGSFDSLLKKSDSDQWYNTDYIHPCSIKDFKKLAIDLNLKIITTFDVVNHKKFFNGEIPSNLFCKEVLFHITNE
tara:strand:- start:459 stop:1052 length:594 start_codon:yes stop_codon:yes gene_type:complete